jgi:hypothetical protein
LCFHCIVHLSWLLSFYFFVQLFSLCVGNGDLSFSCSARFSTSCICIATLHSFSHTCFSFLWLFILHHTFYITHCTIFESHLLFFAYSSSYFLFLVLIFYVFDVCKFFFCNYLSFSIGLRCIMYDTPHIL